jgi:transcriptional regulator with XRE-family HTH domain
MSLVGKEIKMKRVAKQITQKKMAETIGMSAQSLSNIESGKGLLSPSKIKATSKMLRIKQEKLVDLIVMDYRNGLTKQIKASANAK